ncbi:hypothetical protein CBF34_06380 [Vagococcus penaei]|uniref:Uncharacterized protein n=1 Tax=Vagococcus penaei TaxID=633807 RepID=A0A1Q2D756_9ENTE|nr:DsbA family protein [Vagococcus penaei]AQP54160.1 hypothetical protein BW732_07960 [Vagococcus penaei]RSU02159.1 hypothetical protein CBF34_06380 [Vagococcus penaei]
MIEIYLFINPLDERSFNLEKKFLNFIKADSDWIQLRWIPILNPQVLQRYLLDNHLNKKNLIFRNQLFELLYTTCLDFKAVQLQGQALAKQFLMQLQKKILLEKNDYTDNLIEQILNDLGVDLDAFIVDRQSQLIIDFFQMDQQIAHEMKVERFSSAVIFNYATDDNFGILLTDDTPDDIIQSLLEPDVQQIKPNLGPYYSLLQK